MTWAYILFWIDSRFCAVRRIPSDDQPKRESAFPLEEQTLGSEEMRAASVKPVAQCGAAVLLLLALCHAAPGRLTPLAVISSARTPLGRSIGIIWIV